MQFERATDVHGPLLLHTFFIHESLHTIGCSGVPCPPNPYDQKMLTAKEALRAAGDARRAIFAISHESVGHETCPLTSSVEQHCHVVTFLSLRLVACSTEKEITCLTIKVGEKGYVAGTAIRTEWTGVISDTLYLPMAVLVPGTLHFRRGV